MGLSEFGTIVDEEFSHPKLKEFGEVVEVSPPNSLKSIQEDVPKQVLRRGAMGALGTYGDLLDLIRAQHKEKLLPGQEKKLTQESDILEKLSQNKPVTIAELSFLSDDDLAPQVSRLGSRKDVGEFIEELGGPGEAKTILGRLAGAPAEFLGSFAALPTGLKAFQAGSLGSLLGEATREVGGPEWLATAIDIGTSLRGGTASKKLIPGKNQKKIVAFLEGQGFSPEEITPLIQSEKKVSLLGKVARGKTKALERFKASRTKLGEAYDNIKEAGYQIKGTNPEKYRFIEDSSEILDRLSPEFRKLILPNYKEAVNSGLQLNNLVDFYQDIGRKVKGISGGKSVLNKLKTPILQAMERLDSTAAENYKMTNTLYGSVSKALKKLKPKEATHWLDQVATLTGVGGLFTPYHHLGMGLLKGLVAKKITTEGLKKLSTSLLTNPKFQNLHRRALEAIKNNKRVKALALLRKLNKDVSKEHPEVSKNLSKQFNEDLFKII